MSMIINPYRFASGGAPPATGASLVATSSAATTADATSLAINVPSGSVAGDVMVIHLALDGGSASNLNPTASGFRRIYRYPDSAAIVAGYVLAKELTAGDISGGSVTISWTTSEAASATAASLRDVGILDFITTANGNGVTSLAHTAGTTADNDELLLLFSSVRDSVPETITNPGGTTSQENIASSGSVTETRSALASVTQTTAGATSAYSWSYGASTAAVASKVGVRNPISNTVSAIEFVGAATLSNVGDSTERLIHLNALTGGTDTHVQPGDLIILGFCIAITSGTDRSAAMLSPGFTQAAYVLGTDIMFTHLSCQYRVADKTDCAVIVPGTAGGSSGQAAIAYVFRGVDQTTPLDVAVTTASGSNTGQPNAPSITPSTSGAVVVAVHGAGNTAFAAPLTTSDLSNLVQTQGNDTWPGQVAIGWYDWVSGAFNPAALGGGSISTSSSWAAVSMALRPA